MLSCAVLLSGIFPGPELRVSGRAQGSLLHFLCLGFKIKDLNRCQSLDTQTHTRSQQCHLGQMVVDSDGLPQNAHLGARQEGGLIEPNRVD